MELIFNDINNNTDNNLIEKSFEGLKYLEFKPLNSLGIKNIYTLKDLDFSRNDKNLNKDENYFKLSKAFNINPDNIINIFQTHSKNILIIENDEDLKKSRDNYDASITTRKDFALLTRNADCILFIIYDSKKKILANVHSGWKGTVKRIMEEVLNLFQNRFKSNFNDIHVAISPSIRKCHFEVEEDVKNIFEKEFKEADSKLYIQEKKLEENNKAKEEKEKLKLKQNKKEQEKESIKKYYIDTIYLNKYMMKKYGILDENIYDFNLCSVCNKDIIHSYRGAEVEDKEKRAVFIVQMM